MAIAIDHTLRCVTCTECGRSSELKGRTPESLIIAADSFRVRHQCRQPDPSSPPTDRWKELFGGIQL